MLVVLHKKNDSIGTCIERRLGVCVCVTAKNVLANKLEFFDVGGGGGVSLSVSGSLFYIYK